MCKFNLITWEIVHFAHFFHVSPMHPSPSTMWQNSHYLRLLVLLMRGRRVSRKLGMSTRYIQGAVYLELPSPESSVAELHIHLPRISGEEAITDSSYLSSPTLFFFFFPSHPGQNGDLSLSFSCIINIIYLFIKFYVIIADGIQFNDEEQSFEPAC